SSRRRHTRFSRDWSSDVCSSDLLDFLVQHFRETDRLHEYFDIRLMQVRRSLDLPLILTSSLDSLPESQRDALETEYLKVCREVRSEERRVGEERRARRPRQSR